MTYKPPPEESTNANGAITERTKVALPIRVLLPLIGMIVSGAIWGTLWLNGRFNSLEIEIQNINRNVRMNWTLQDQREWASDAKRLNSSSITVPDPNEIFIHNRPYLIDPNQNRP